MNKGDILTFDIKKNFTFITSLGAGGTGDTYLFKDETTNMLFAFKEYAPKNEKGLDDYYERFVKEITILFNISHPNIVRIYNYYLNPQQKTGFLQMEYVDGVSIDQYDPYKGGKTWEEIFCNTINAFEYLELNHILHRDIRPANIMINNKGDVKIIDFGFGKQTHEYNKEENSVLLNWPVTELPDEIPLNKEYDEGTEIYFVGSLFKHLLGDSLREFRYNNIIEKMIKTNREQRYGSFSTIVADISSGVMKEVVFSKQQKHCYRTFADMLSFHIRCYNSVYSPKKDFLKIESDLAELIRSSALEEYIQDNSQLISCFIANAYVYIPRKDIPVQIVIDFYYLVLSLDEAKRKILFDNIFMRLSSIEVELEEDALPFS